MRGIPAHRFPPWLLAAVCVGVGCRDKQPRTVEALLAESTPEYEVLVPSLKEAAGKLLSEANTYGREFEGKIRLRLGSNYNGGATKVDITADEVIFDYTIAGIQGIKRASSITHPLQTVVVYGVTEFERTSGPFTVTIDTDEEIYTGDWRGLSSKEYPDFPLTRYRPQPTDDQPEVLKRLPPEVRLRPACRSLAP
jgi:hypothetical protein